MEKTKKHSAHFPDEIMDVFAMFTPYRKCAYFVSHLKSDWHAFRVGPTCDWEIGFEPVVFLCFEETRSFFKKKKKKATARSSRLQALAATVFCIQSVEEIWILTLGMIGLHYIQSIQKQSTELPQALAVNIACLPRICHVTEAACHIIRMCLKEKSIAT